MEAVHELTLFVAEGVVEFRPLAGTDPRFRAFVDEEARRHLGAHMEIGKTSGGYPFFVKIKVPRTALGLGQAVASRGTFWTGSSYYWTLATFSGTVALSWALSGSVLATVLDSLKTVLTFLPPGSSKSNPEIAGKAAMVLWDLGKRDVGGPTR